MGERAAPGIEGGRSERLDRLAARIDQAMGTVLAPAMILADDQQPPRLDRGDRVRSLGEASAQHDPIARQARQRCGVDGIKQGDRLVRVEHRRRGDHMLRRRAGDQPVKAQRHHAAQRSAQCVTLGNRLRQPWRLAAQRRQPVERLAHADRVIGQHRRTIGGQQIEEGDRRQGHRAAAAQLAQGREELGLFGVGVRYEQRVADGQRGDRAEQAAAARAEALAADQRVDLGMILALAGHEADRMMATGPHDLLRQVGAERPHHALALRPRRRGDALRVA